MKSDNQNSNIIGRQTFSDQLTARETPLIQVRPLRITVACEVGKEVDLTCSVQAPYAVTFRGLQGGGEI